ncbi:hypothetical protein KUTeg_022161 [Tegillarca granosa]|uniref:Uncharacterized protein n=1 Tax=Tegillarca granosa TaxID=220873 RepID=A0ABQ9EAR2_TEGGR|nr:hypothetical protein KUTeg_022161 [Tegillarca granosa]
MAAAELRTFNQQQQYQTQQQQQQRRPLPPGQPGYNYPSPRIILLCCFCRSGIGQNNLTVFTLIEKQSKLQPLGGACDPSEIAKAICFMASDDSACITGQILCVDGGRHILPSE